MRPSLLIVRHICARFLASSRSARTSLSTGSSSDSETCFLSLRSAFFFFSSFHLFLHSSRFLLSSRFFSLAAPLRASSESESCCASGVTCTSSPEDSLLHFPRSGSHFFSSFHFFLHSSLFLFSSRLFSKSSASAGSFIFGGCSCSLSGTDSFAFACTCSYSSAACSSNCRALTSAGCFAADFARAPKLAATARMLVCVVMWTVCNWSFLGASSLAEGFFGARKPFTSKASSMASSSTLAGTTAGFCRGLSLGSSALSTREAACLSRGGGSRVRGASGPIPSAAALLSRLSADFLPGPSIDRCTS
mmetsp:Transcript_43216/g.119505  ORF Transcript_43216/g.119505 Transcript_43216/m.119505 type:complete len:305 (+) Transcript_43216:389-1303(+)